MRAWRLASALADRADSCTDRARSDKNAARIAGCRLAGSCKKIGVKLPVSRVPGQKFFVYRRTVYQFLQSSDKFAARNFACAECGEMGRVHLAIDHAKLPAFKLPGEMRQRALRGVADVTKHGFAVEHASDADTIQTTDQFQLQLIGDTVLASSLTHGRAHCTAHFVRSLPPCLAFDLKLE